MRTLLPTINFLLLTAAYAALFLERDPSPSYRAAMAAGALVVSAAALLTYRPAARRRWLEAGPRPGPLRLALAVMPWVALTVIVFARGLWWTQRAPALRFFALYALANWSLLWCLAHPSAPQRGWSEGPGRACAILALILMALGIQGAAFGFTPFGCGLSLVVAAAAALIAFVGRFGGRTAAIKVFVLTTASLVGFAAAEAAVRLARAGQSFREVDSREYARQFYSLTPPHTVFVNPPGTLDEFAPAIVEINSKGIRGPELTAATADVLLIGDSMIEARQLPWEQTIGPRLQQALQARGTPLRVVAHGMRGWSPLLEWNWYLKVGRTLHPKTVLLFFFWNDLWPAGSEASAFRARLDGDGRPESFDVPVDPNWLWYKHARSLRLAAEAWDDVSVGELRRAFVTLAARSTKSGPLDEAAAVALARSLSEPPLTSDQLARIVSASDADVEPALRRLTAGSFWSSFRPPELWSDAQRRAADTTAAVLTRFAGDVASAGGRFAIVYVPNPLQIDPRECSVGRLFEHVDSGVVLPPASGIQTWLRGVASRGGFELVDLSDDMRAFDRSSPGAPPLYLRADCHWTARGHQFMADRLAGWLAKAPDGSR